MRLLKLYFLLWLCFVQSVDALAQEKITGEQVKTAYLYNFLQFIEWPEEVAQRDPIKVGVVGKIPESFRDNLAKINSKKIEKRSIQVEYFPDAETVISKSNLIAMLYLFELPDSDLLKLLGYTSQKAILTVGDQDSFIESGGIIAFIEKDNRILFDINLVEAEKNKFRVPSRLQRIANQVLR